MPGGRDRARTCDLVVVSDGRPVKRTGKTIHELLDQCPRLSAATRGSTDQRRTERNCRADGAEPEMVSDSSTLIALVGPPEGVALYRPIFACLSGRTRLPGEATFLVPGGHGKGVRAGPSFSLALSAQWQATGPPLSSTAPSSDTNRHR